MMAWHIQLSKVASPACYPSTAGGIQHLVKYVLRGSEAAPAAGAAHALAALTTGRNASVYRAAVLAAKGVPALLM